MSEEKKKDQVPAPQASTAPAEAAAAPATVALPAEEVAQLRQKAEERNKLFERLQRTVADYDNYQKRVKRDRQAWEEAKVRQFVREYLPVLDDLERLTAAFKGKLTLEDARTAFTLLEDKWRRILADWQIEAIAAAGAPFDPTFHEAVRFQETDAAPEGSVLEETRRGYTMGGGVLRAAQVVVAKAPAKALPAKNDAAPAGASEES